MQDLPLVQNSIESSSGNAYSVSKQPIIISESRDIQDTVVIEESLNIMDKEKELIEKMAHLRKAPIPIRIRLDVSLTL